MKAKYARPRLRGAKGFIEVPLRTDVDQPTKEAFLRLARLRNPEGRASERSAAAYLRELVEKEVAMNASLLRNEMNLATVNL